MRVKNRPSSLCLDDLLESLPGQRQTDLLSFITHSEEVLGDARREMTHRYRGQLKAGELHFVVESSASHSPHDPVEFIARRVSK